MMEIVNLVSDLFLEFVGIILAYVLIFQFPVTVKKRNWFAAIGVLFFIHLFVALHYSVFDSISLGLYSMVVVPILLFEVPRKKACGLYFLVAIVFSSISVMLTFFICMIYKVRMREIIENPQTNLFCEVVPILAMLVVMLIRKIRNKEPEELALGKQQYVLYNVGALCVFIMLATLQYFCNEESFSTITVIFGMLTSLACIVFLFLLLWHGREVSKQERLNKRINDMELFTKLEETHFAHLVVQDEKIRKFRHDFHAHVLALRGYAHENRIQELFSYLEEMEDESAYNLVGHYTGDVAIDAVIGELMEKAEKEDISVSYKGNFSRKSGLSSYEYCAIFYNLFLNAIEACMKIEDIEARWIEIKTMTYEEKDVIQIKNSIKEQVIVRDNKMETTKMNKDEHGFGSQNVLDVVNKHQGVVRYESSIEEFKVEIVL